MNGRLLAMPHSSGDTIPGDIIVQPELNFNIHTGGNLKGNDLAVCDSTTSMPRSSVATTPGFGLPTPDASIELIGSGVKVLLHAIRDLERHGIDAAASMPLPKIVVVGDQSAGKSSLIEAISEISVPRDSGTCTRCVLHINLRDEPTSQWRCDVSLVQKYSPTGDPNSPLFPWTEMGQTVHHFKTVYDKQDLENVIRRAQVATLNPQEDYRRYLNCRNVSKEALKFPFSPNIISLEIFAPGLPDLSFYDLPGIISQSPDGGQETVQLISKLGEIYMSQENTIILLAVPMEIDIDNSMASALVDKVGANHRTIGVLTKPDRLQSDDRVDVWKSVLQGQNFRKGHGYFVVKQPSQADLNDGISHGEARVSEQNFFNSVFWTARFGDIDVKDRLGTRNLQRNLSDKLAHLILEVMPKLEDQVVCKHAEVEDQLAELPEPPQNALQVVSQAVIDFTQAVRSMIDGTEPNILTESWKKIKNEFHESIINGQRPTLLVASPEYEADDGRSSPAPTPCKINYTPSKLVKRNTQIIDLSSDDEEIVTPTKKRKDANGTPKMTARSSKREDSICSVIPIARDRECTLDFLALRKSFTLAELRTTLDSFSTSGLPSVVELKAVDHMILLTLENWKDPLKVLLNNLKSAMQNSLAKSLQDKVYQWRATKLFEEMQEAYRNFLNRHMESMTQYVFRALKIERVKPITRDEKLMSRYVKEEQAILEAARLKKRYMEYARELEKKYGKEVNKNWDDKTRKQATEVLDADPYSREVGVMARIRAYYQISAMRFVDQVVQAVEAELLIKFREELYHDLMTALQVFGEDGYKNANRLVADDVEREERRSLLKERKRRLEQASDRIKQMHLDFCGQNPVRHGS
ncbi:hypothetical protein, variant 1 [Verruconis gallopava]|uniref:GED domain-containing protein n=1 Tax=Verruconis gallopava TaxID=253628 RepID=A0A0D1YUK0_9PEZI|nr:hypothetical protein, variant 1 [Verruconis gallopava]KIW04352.1 hypothetical protein, variant 1 [Verruconis gallopava]